LPAWMRHEAQRGGGGGGGAERFRNPKADHRSKNQPVYPVTIQHWRIGTA